MHYKTPFIKSTSRIHFVGKNFIYRSIMSLVSLNPGFLLAKIQQNLKLILIQFNSKTIHNNTMNFRSVDSFYQLSSLLKSHHPWLSVPPLPLRPSFWISSVRQVFLWRWRWWQDDIRWYEYGRQWYYGVDEASWFRYSFLFLWSTTSVENIFFWSAKTNVQHFEPKYYGQDVLHSCVMSWIWVQSLPQLISLFRPCPSEEREHLVDKFLIPPLECLQLVLAFRPGHTASKTNKDPQPLG